LGLLRDRDTVEWRTGGLIANKGHVLRKRGTKDKLPRPENMSKQTKSHRDRAGRGCGGKGCEHKKKKK